MKTIDITQLWQEQAIHETIVSTENQDGSTRLSPLGATRQGSNIIIAPFAPSTTLDNIQRSKQAVINLCQDVEIFAGCIIGKHQWQTTASTKVKPQRLQQASSHIEVEIIKEQTKDNRSKFTCNILHTENHLPFAGFNRAQAAVIEAAVHISRIGIMPTEQIQQHLTELQSQIDKTAGARELQAWQDLQQHFKEKTA